MAVTMMCKADAQGARPTSHDGIYVRTTYVGKVVSLRERNGYDDSDFFCTVWDDEQQKFRSFEYASTRGWSYCNGASVDADDELMQKWHAEERRRMADSARIHRYYAEVKLYGKALADVQKDVALPGGQWERLESLGIGTSLFVGSLKLLRTKLRSPFRKSLRSQLQEWLRGESKYLTPFSPKQRQCL